MDKTMLEKAWEWFKKNKEDFTAVVGGLAFLGGFLPLAFAARLIQMFIFGIALLYYWEFARAKKLRAGESNPLSADSVPMPDESSGTGAGESNE